MRLPTSCFLRLGGFVRLHVRIAERLSKILSQAGKYTERFAAAYFNVGVILIQSKQYKRAIRELSKAIEIFPAMRRTVKKFKAELGQ
jgi:hypothetical protein